MRYAIRSLLKAPGYSLLVILTLALGVGANTAVFSVVRGVLLRPLPHANGDQLVYLKQSAERAGQEDVKFSVPEIVDLRSGSTALTGIAEYSAMPFTMLGGDQPVQVQAGIVSGNYFEVMGLGAVLGRTIGSGDDGPTADPVMMLTFRYWQTVFSGDRDVLGRTYRMNGRTVTIVGVAAPAPPFPGETDVFVNLVTSPHHLDASMVHGRSHRMTDVFARLAPGSGVTEAQAEVDGIASRMYGDHPENYDAAAGYAVEIQPLRDALTSNARRTLILLMAVAALVLLTACANVANLVLTRTLRREREFAVRWALGSSAGRLRRILLAEATVLALLGTLAGVVMAFVGLDLLVGFAERFTARASEIRIDGAVLGFALVVSVAAAFVFAFMPPLRSQEVVGATLTRGGSRTTGGRRRLQRGLIVAQVAASVTVLTAAGLLTRTLLRLNAVDLGVELENTLTFEAPVNPDFSMPVAQALALLEEMERRIAALPGVTNVGVGLSVPLRSNPIPLEVRAEGAPPRPGEPIPMANFRTATSTFFESAGMRVVRGRDFEATDHMDARKVVILNQALAERLFGDEDPIDKRVTWTGQVLAAIGMQEEWKTVVGVVNNTLDDGPDADPPLQMFEPMAQNAMGFFPGAFVVRATAAETLAPQILQIIQELAPEVPVLRMATLEQIRNENVASERLNTLLVGMLGALALAIAAIGLAGALSFFISERTAEIGIRMSLGAAPSQVLRMVLADGAVLLGIGTALGLAGSFAVATLLEGFLYGIAPRDPLTFVAVVTLMGLVGLAACSVPALRAARVDPLVAIRKDG
jgi:putative ABC transport system permease protein